MSAFQEITHAMLSEDTKGWAQWIGIDEATLRRLLLEQDSINLPTARKIMENTNKRLNTKWTIETFFHPEKVRGYETERTVTYEYWKGRPISKDEWISYYRYIFEKRLRGYAIFIALVLLLIVGIVGAWVLYFMR